MKKSFSKNFGWVPIPILAQSSRKVLSLSIPSIPSFKVEKVHFEKNAKKFDLRLFRG